MSIQIQLRRDNSTNWENKNPILAQGEMGLELDTNKFKIGDGLTNWNDLPYFKSGKVDSVNGKTGNVTIELADLANSSQMLAINSGANTDKIAQIETNKTSIGTLSSLTTTEKGSLVGAVNELNSTKQDNISDLQTIRSGAALGATSVQSISSGTSNGSINVDGSDVSVKGLGSAAYTPTTDYATSTQGGLADSALQPSDVIDNTSSSTTNKPLSANMGKSLQEQVDSLKQRGHFLSLWNCATGLAQSNPPESPYTYQSGDYFIIGTVATGSGTNYRPNGSSYTTGVASTTVETQAVDENDVYYYDGANWLLQINTQKDVTFGSVAGDPYDNTNLASALNAKQNELTEGAGIDISSDTISNTGVRSVSTGSTNGTISVNTGGTSAEVAVAGLGTAAYTASTAYDVSGSASTAETNAKNYADGLSSNYATAAQGTLADTALQNLATASNSLTILGTAATNSYSVNIGPTSQISGGGSSTAIGYGSKTGGSAAVAIGYNSNATKEGGICLGYHSTTNKQCISIGKQAVTSATGAMQFGTGTNSEAGSVQFSLTTDGTNYTNYKLLGSDGKIPAERLSNAITTTQITIATSDWSGNTCTKSVTGVTANSNVFVTPAQTLSNIKAYSEANVFCSSIGSGTVTFTCETTPTVALTVNIGVN